MPALPAGGHGGLGGVHSAQYPQAQGATQRLLRTGETGGVHLHNGPNWGAPLSPGTVVHSAQMGTWCQTTVEGAFFANAVLEGSPLRRQPCRRFTAGLNGPEGVFLL